MSQSVANYNDMAVIGFTPEATKNVPQLWLYAEGLKESITHHRAFGS